MKIRLQEVIYPLAGGREGEDSITGTQSLAEAGPIAGVGAVDRTQLEEEKGSGFSLCPGLQALLLLPLAELSRKLSLK